MDTSGQAWLLAVHRCGGQAADGMVRRMTSHAFRRRAGACVLLLTVGAAAGHAQRPAFQVHEATIADIQRALQTRRITTVALVEQYLRRVKAFNGTCVNEPQGILGPVTT